MNGKLTGPIDLIKKSFIIFFQKDNLTYFLSIYILALPFTVLMEFQNVYPNQFSNSPYAIGILILFIIIHALAVVAGVTAVINVLTRGKESFLKTYSYALKHFLGFALISILVFFIIFFGLLLLIIPGIIFLVWYIFSIYIYLEDGRGIKEPLGRSKNLAKGYFWQILGRVVVFWIFGVIISVVFSAIPYIGRSLASLLGALILLPTYLLYRELVVLKTETA